MSCPTRFFLFFSLITATAAAAGQTDFCTNFSDSTLHMVVEPILTGEKDISVHSMHKSPGWWGRRVNTSQLLYPSDLQIDITDNATGDTIWRDSKTVSMFVDDNDRRVAVKMPLPRREATAHLHFNVWAAPDETAEISKSIMLTRELSTSLAITLSRPNDYVVLRQPANPNQAITIAILAEGYTEAEHIKFLRHAIEADSALFAHEAFRKHADRFRIVAVPLISEDSGISYPSKDIKVRTPLEAHFDSYGLERLLTIPHACKIWEILDGIPADHVMILANTESYGGSGSYNDYCISSSGYPNWHHILIHEFGHSFGHLADEYADSIGTDEPMDIEPLDPNITTLVDFSHKWQPLIDSGEATLIEGAAYNSKGMWRGCEKCLMRTLDDGDFCAVCTRALSQLILFLTQESSTPSAVGR